jgi:hypothetical protein
MYPFPENYCDACKHCDGEPGRFWDSICLASTYAIHAPTDDKPGHWACTACREQVGAACPKFVPKDDPPDA